MYYESCLPRIGSNIKILRSANVLGCTLETLLDRKEAAEWAEAQYTEKPGQTEAQKKTTKKSTARSRSTKLCGS